jgi:hypothetical protein
MPQTYWSKITQVEPSVGKTKQGKPVRTVRTDSGKEVSLMGTFQQLASLQPGADIEHSQPSEFNGRHYATLVLASSPTNNTPKRPDPPILGGLPKAVSAPASPTWEEYKGMAFAAHSLAEMLEPDLPHHENEPFIDRSSARTAIVNTVMIAFSNGKVQAPKPDTRDPWVGPEEHEPEIPDQDVPWPEDAA